MYVRFLRICKGAKGAKLSKERAMSDVQGDGSTMTNVVSLADVRTARRAAERQDDPAADPDILRALAPWPVSRKGNPWLQVRDHVFVALEPRWRRASWRLWIKEPDGAGRILPRHFASFATVQRAVIAILAEESKPDEA